MRLKKDFFLHQVGDEFLLMHNTESDVNFNHLISMNPTAVFLWKYFADKEFDAETMADCLTEHYQVERETALSDAAELIRNWQKAGLTE